MLSEPVVVEEKLDGANVMLWREGSGLQAATRAGAGGRDRAGQLGPLRAWLAPRQPELLEHWSEGSVLYAEWLWLRHSVRYDALPDSLAVLDLRLLGGFADVDTRDSFCSSAGLVTPPRVFEGVLGCPERLAQLLTTSAFGSEAAEGLIVRLQSPRPDLRVAKLLAPAFDRRSDSGWADSMERNTVAR